MAFAVSGPACAGLKTADEAAPIVDDDSGSPESTETTPDEAGATETKDAGVDAGNPPEDFECTAPWSKSLPAKPECAPRQVRDIDDNGFMATGVSIARTPAGRIGIVFNNELDSESGEMRLWHFIPKDASFTPQVVIKEANLGYHAGYTTRIVGSAPDVLHVLEHNLNDAVGDVELSRLEGGKAPMTTSELVVPGVRRPTELGLAIDSAGTVYASAVVRGAASSSPAKLVVRMKPAGAAVANLPDIATTLLPNLAPGTGATSFAIGAADQVNLVYHFCYLASSEPPSDSTPRFHTLAGGNWSDPKTLDNSTVDGLAGFSPRLVMVGNRKYAAYYFRKAGQAGVPTADLRLAKWEKDSDLPTVEVLDQGIPSADAMDPHYRVAMAVDKYGLIHLAIARPSTSKASYIEYRRQTRNASGDVKWLSDIVDEFEAVDGLPESNLVDIVVDENARPHIAYISGVDYKVRYATRYDR